MEPLHTLIATGVITFTLGILIGALVARKLSSTEQKNRDLEKHLHEKQSELKAYKQEVTSHFVKTAGLLNNLTENYRDIHNYLAESAEQLSTKDSLNTPIIEAIPEPKPKTVNNQAEMTSPPLDYAPKSSPYDQGTLENDHHLEKVQLQENPVTATIPDTLGTAPDVKV